MSAPVHVVGTGLISAIGNTVREGFRALQAQSSGIGSLTLFETTHNLPVGEVKLSNESLQEKLNLQHALPRTAMLGIHAAREALRGTGVRIKENWRVGLIAGTTVGGMDKTERFYQRFQNSNASGRLRDVIYHSCGSISELIADDLGIRNFISTVNTACSSSVNSIILGCRLIRSGQLDIVVAGGADALTKYTLNGFISLMILDKKPCRPFDASRNGLNLGEGAGFVVLASEKVLREEKAVSLCTVAGFGTTSDAYHQTASSPEGRGSFAAMSAALKTSGLEPGDIDYINVHGTGTQNNDLSEGTAIRKLFGDSIPKLSSTKGNTGHTLGASGGIEAVFSVLSLQEQCTFANLRFETPMPEVNIVPQEVHSAGKVTHVMSNSFGFGGNCSSIIFSKS